MKQLSLSKDQLITGEWDICNENTPEDVEEAVKSQAQSSLKCAQKPSTDNLDSIEVLSNGFFDNQRGLVRKLKSYGNVYMQTSLDSNNEQITDRNRGKKGVFTKIGSLIDISKEEGFDLSLQGHNLDGKQSRDDSYKGVSLLIIDRMLQLGNSVQGDGLEKIGRASCRERV